MNDASEPIPADAARPPTGWVDRVAELGIALEPGEVERLGAYLVRLLEANRTMNLTAIREVDAAWERHLLDALTLVPYLAVLEETQADEDAEGGGEDAPAGPLRVIDVGSGGGVPALPLAIVLPQVSFTLLEATGKKADFLAACADALGLTNVEVVRERAETAGHDRERYRERFDAATARAVGPLRVLLELTLPFVRPGGVLLAIKGERAAEELAEAKRALHALHATPLEPVRTPTGRIVVVEKRAKTPRIYPRKPGEPKRVPL